MQIALGALALVIVAVVVVVAIAYRVIFRRPLPRTSGSLVIGELGAEVRISRDARGLPLVEAATWRDAFLATGFLHGQDRLWQMEVQRRLAAGRLSEVVGPRALPVDRLMRRLGLRRVSEAEWHVTHAAGPVREEVLAYTAGVNAAMRDRPLPAEFTILRHRPEPWEPEDTLAVGRLLSFSQSGNWQAQLLRMRMLKELGPELTAAVDPVLLGARAASLEDLDAAEGRVSAQWLEELAAADDLVGLSSWAPASNSWVVAGERTVSGRPLLANDPHGSIEIPSSWYRLRLRVGEDRELAGATFCGCPYALLGRNREIAWGLVNANVSIQDLYVERFNPNNPLQFDDRGTWQDAVRFREVIRVRGGRPEVEDVLVTRRGPVVSPALPGNQPPMSLRWTGFDSEVDSIGWVRRLNLATDWKSFRAAVSSCSTPALGITYADREGNIGYRLSGFLPVRRRGQGRVPSRGWEADDEWRGFVPLEEMPELKNPASGTIVAANQPVALATSPHVLVAEPAGQLRAARIEAVLAANPALDAAACAELQADLLSPAAVAFRDLVTTAADRFPPDPPVPAVALLRSWDGRMTTESAAAALYREAAAQVFEASAGSRMSAPLRRVLLGGGENPLFPDSPFGGRLGPAVVTLLTDMLVAGSTGTLWEALREAWRGLERSQGKDAARWTLGRSQEFRLAHPLAAAVGALAPILSRGPFTTPGDADTVRVASVAATAPGQGRINAAFYRAVYDLSEGGDSGWMQVPGQSGQAASRHYADLLEPWLDARLDPIGFGHGPSPGGDALVLRPG